MGYLQHIIVLLFACSYVSSAQTGVEKAIETAKLHINDSSFFAYSDTAEQLAIAHKDYYCLAQVYQLKGNHYYSRQPDSSVRYQHKAYKLFMDNGHKNEGVICLHSIAFAYAEVKQDYPTALDYVANSIEIHKKLKDTLEMANMYKYMGYLKSKTGGYTDAKQDVYTAMALYNCKDNKDGLAVSYYDMAAIYLLKKDTDSALVYLKKAKNYWTQQDNRARIFGINNLLIKAYGYTGEHDKVTGTIAENERILTTHKIYHAERLKFYACSSEYYDMPGRTLKPSTYHKQYTRLTDSLRQAGLIIPETN